MTKFPQYYYENLNLIIIKKEGCVYMSPNSKQLLRNSNPISNSIISILLPCTFYRGESLVW